MRPCCGDGEGIVLHGADALVVNISQTPGVVILEYEVQGDAVPAQDRPSPETLKRLSWPRLRVDA